MRKYFLRKSLSKGLNVNQISINNKILSKIYVDVSPFISMDSANN